MARRHGAVLIVGFHERQGERLFNAAGVFYPDGRRIVERKHLIMDAERRKKHAVQAATCLSPDAIEQCIRLNVAQVACNQAGWDATSRYFHPGGAQVAMCDGSVRFVGDSVDLDVWVAAGTRSGQESAPLP
jgi:prepilin-type processing-associated H-X9-DG protein